MAGQTEPVTSIPGMRVPTRDSGFRTEPYEEEDCRLCGLRTHNNRRSATNRGLRNPKTARRGKYTTISIPAFRAGDEHDPVAALYNAYGTKNTEDLQHRTVLSPQLVVDRRLQFVLRPQSLQSSSSYGSVLNPESAVQAREFQIDQPVPTAASVVESAQSKSGRSMAPSFLPSS